jgi:hypothetical protein
MLLIAIINTSGLPSREELLILALGLGGSGNNYDPIDRSGSVLRPDSLVIARPLCYDCGGPDPSVVDNRSNRRCPDNGRNGQICSHIPGT